MEPLQIKEILDATKGKLMTGNPETIVTGISTDSRTIKPGEFFVPIKGENFDGHNYIQNAIDRGAVGSFIEGNKSVHINSKKSFNLIEVNNSKYAMGELAKYYRQLFSLSYIAITGSNGKTSTKEMTAAVLSTRYNVLKSEGSFNNDIGLPLTLFQLNKDHQVAVLEMGMNNYGEIKRMVFIAPPDIGVITNVAEAHIEFFGHLDNVAKAKFELLESMSSANTAVLNADDPRVYKFSKKTKAKSVFFGIRSDKTNFFAKDIKFVSNPYGIEFSMITPSGISKIFLPVLGEHQVYNALASAAASWQIAPDMDMIREGLKKFEPPKMRMQITPIANFVVINDAYNANPKSMKAALETLQKISTKGKKIAVLADMLELGDYRIQAHQEIGSKVAESDIQILITIGELAKQIAMSAIQKGFDKSNIYQCETKDEAFDKLINFIEENDLVLVKGSRKMKLEDLVNKLKEQCHQKLTG